MSCRQTSIRNLQIITALDSLSYGLLYRFLQFHIQKLGDSHVTVDILMIGTLIGDLLSSEIIKTLNRNKSNKQGLFFVLCCSLLTHLMIAASTSCWFLITMRILFSAINQSQNLCLAILLDKESNTNIQEKLRTNYSVLSGSGYILGPIISGYLFEKEKGFRYICMLAAFLTFINMAILTTVEPDRDQNRGEECPDKSLTTKALELISEHLERLKTCEWEIHWDIIFFKYSFTFSILIFSSKFPQILAHNYEDISSINIGWTIAYMNALVFASTYAVERKACTHHQYPLIFASELSFFLIAALLFLACYSPTYQYFLLLLIPIALLRSLIIDMWKDLFLERNNDDLEKLNNSIGIMAELTIPLVFGIVCNQMGAKAVILFSCIPMVLCWVVTRFHSRFLNFDSKKKLIMKRNRRFSLFCL